MIEADVLLEQLKDQLKVFTDTGQTDIANKLQELINSINNKKDDAGFKIQITTTLKKFDGEYEEGKEPVETLVFTED